MFDYKSIGKNSRQTSTFGRYSTAPMNL